MAWVNSFNPDYDDGADSALPLAGIAGECEREGIIERITGGNMHEIPVFVIAALAEVRERGETNMFDRERVIDLCEEYGYITATDWLAFYRTLYMDALNAMGEYLSNRGADGGGA